MHLWSILRDLTPLAQAAWGEDAQTQVLATGCSEKGEATVIKLWKASVPVSSKVDVGVGTDADAEAAVPPVTNTSAAEVASPTPHYVSLQRICLDGR